MMFISNTHFDLVSRGSANEFLFRKMIPFVCSVWFSVSGFVFYLISLVTRYIFRFHGGDGSQKDDSNCSKVQPETTIFENSDSDEAAEKDMPKFCFKFQFQTSQDIIAGNEESKGSVTTEEKAPTVSTSKYQFLSGKDFCGFIEEPEVGSFTVKELYEDSNYGSFSNKEIIDEGFLSEKDLPQLNSEVEAIQEEMVEKTSTNSCYEAGETESQTMTQEQLSGKEEESIGSSFNKDIIDGEFLSEKDLPKLNSEADAVEEEIVGNSLTVSHCKARETELETMTQEQLSGKEESVDSFSNQETIDEGFLPEKDLSQLNPKADAFEEKIAENNSVESHCKLGETEPESLTKEQISGKEESVISEDDPTEVRFLGEEDFFASDSASESTSSSDDFSLENLSLDPTDGFLLDIDFDRPSQTEIGTLNLRNSNMVSSETIDNRDQSSSSVNPIRDAENSKDQPHFLNSRMVDFEILSDTDTEDEDEEEEEEEENFGDVSGKTEEPNEQNRPEDENELETLWEHQDLIEQLKMELKKVRATGLPTIFEESESPRVMEDLKPWKIDEKFLHEDQMDELHKFYKSYRERMRKFDILNYQKMYAIGFLQLKDPLQSISNRKSSIPSILCQNFWLGKCQRVNVDPTVKFIGELQNDLEMVYVGHMCLSWEILHWQFGKAHQLQESDAYGFHRYNQVAGEFQQFQVLIQRFLENEPFQGPRVQNYVKNRCVLRNLLQVPVIKEDSFKDKKKSKRGDDNAITIPMLTVIIEESMHIFWDFVKADKNESSLILKGLWRTQVELQNPADLELLKQIRRNFQKKEKKLKDVLKIGNCLVRKFQKPRPGDRSDLILFFSQVDMKLVSRVLNMSRITSEQLVWCDKKLKKINFVDRKIHREPSFLLFPC